MPPPARSPPATTTCRGALSSRPRAWRKPPPRCKNSSTLAQRSVGAAKEIRELIDDSVSRVAEGSALVKHAGKTMQEIVSSVQRVTDIMSEISAAAQERYAGIEQVNHTVTQVDESTQQHAALVEEVSAAARAMEQQATELAQAVALFELEGNAAPMRQPTPAIAPKPRGYARPVPSPAPIAARRLQAVAAGINDKDWQEF